jgi:hypothetical protein
MDIGAVPSRNARLRCPAYKVRLFPWPAKYRWPESPCQSQQAASGSVLVSWGVNGIATLLLDSGSKDSTWRGKSRSPRKHKECHEEMDIVGSTRVAAVTRRLL